MKRLYISIFIPFLIILTLFLFKKTAIQTITFFPIDYNEKFLQSNTNLQLNKDANKIIWESFSKSENPLYLRQDISLLYSNGQLKGVLSKWIENTDVIQLERTISAEEGRLIQAISYHHGEIHQKDERINSIHLMSTNYLYVVKSPYTTLKSFKSPKEGFEVTQKQLLDDIIGQDLQSQWNEWIDHHKINKNNYIVVPLSELHLFKDKNLPQLDRGQTDKVIGQLWEGLYKNYVIPITEKNNNTFPKAFMPIVLFDKQNTHLIVLFNIDNENKILLQKY